MDQKIWRIMRDFILPFDYVTSNSPQNTLVHMDQTFFHNMFCLRYLPYGHRTHKNYEMFLFHTDQKVWRIMRGSIIHFDYDTLHNPA